MEPGWTGTLTPAIVKGIDFLLAAQAIIYMHFSFICTEFASLHTHVIFFFLLCEDRRMRELQFTLNANYV